MNIEVFSTRFDRSTDILEARGAFSSSKHPRDRNGRFTSKLGAAATTAGRLLGVGGKRRAIGQVGSGGKGQDGNILFNLGGGVASGFGARKGAQWGAQFAREHGMGETSQLVGSLVGSYATSRVMGMGGGSIGNAIGKRLGLKQQGALTGTATYYGGAVAGYLGRSGTRRAAGEIGGYLNRKLGHRAGPTGGRRPKTRVTSPSVFEARLEALRAARRGR
ncbi:MAG: hypothetical protein IPH08_03695 [Rhodocyclaceae bacterium]|nr:hypothetical protein [Rhodocyclaceae bacterium]